MTFHDSRSKSMENQQNEECWRIFAMDLGSQFCSVGMYENDGVEMIPDEYGSYEIPSYISFKDGEILVGQSAVNEELSNRENTVYGMKRYLGRKFDDKVVQKDLRKVPFKIVEQEGRAVFEVIHKKVKTIFTPGELMVILIRYLKKLIDTKIQKTSRLVLITVPPSFNDEQRLLIKDAGKRAGFDQVVRIVNEPTSASIAYGVEKTSYDEKRVLVFDFGGEKLDISVLLVESGIFELVSHIENFDVGGDTITDSLCDFFCEYIKKRDNCDIRSNYKSMYLLRNACERTKRDLSENLRTTIEVKKLYDDVDLKYQMSRKKFESFLPIRECIDTIRNVFEQNSDIDRSKIGDIIICGGTSKIPRIRQVVCEYFAGRVKVYDEIDCQHVVANGGAIQASMLCGPGSRRLSDLLIQDITPLSLGIGLKKDHMEVIIRRNTVVPVKKTSVFSVHEFPDVQVNEKNELCVTISIFEGERQLTTNNNLIGKVSLMNVPIKDSTDKMRFGVTIDIDPNFVTRVTVEEAISGYQSEMTIQNESKRLTSEEIEEMIKQAGNFEKSEEQRELEEMIGVKNGLELLAYRIRNVTVGMAEDGPQEGRPGMDEEVRKQVLGVVEELVRWIDSNPKEKKEIYELKKLEFKRQIPELILKILDMKEKEERRQKIPSLDVD